MSEYSNLLEKIGTEYGIVRGSDESDVAWRKRVIYSVLGQIGLASLWDKEEEEQISITHFKHSIEKAYHAYTTIYHELSDIYVEDVEDILN